MTSLDTNIQLLQQIPNMFVPNAYSYTKSTSLFGAWLSCDVSSRHPPSWTNLFLVIRLLNLNDVAQRMETYLSAGATGQDEKNYDSGMSEAESETESETEGESEGQLLVTYL